MVATGWLDGELSPRGREQALALGERRRDVGVVYLLEGTPLEALVGAPFEWQEGWTFTLEA